VMCDRMDVDVWEVIDAAATKPFGFMPFYPGPGLGGHCIPIDPFYLSWKSKQAGMEARFIELAGQVNGRMPDFVVEKIRNALNDACKSVRGSHIHILGAAYKRNVTIITDHSGVNYAGVVENSKLIVDTRNALKMFKSEKIIRL
jgi:UDP-N-acetyl-D-glucosamine dehydrogenase